MEFKVQTYTMRNVFKPRWWQFRLRYRLWRSYRRGRRLHKMFTEEGLKRVNELEAELERKILYGDSSNERT